MTKNILHAAALLWQYTLFRFYVAGGATVLLYFTLFFLFTEAGLWYMVSALLAWVVYYPVNFYLQKFWAFRNIDTSDSKSQLMRHITLTLVNIALNSIALYVLVDYFGVWYILAQGMITSVLSIFSFLIMRRIFQ